MSATIIRTVLRGLSERGGALDNIMGNTAQRQGLVRAIEDGSYEDYLRGIGGGAEELLTNPTFVRMMGRMGDNLEYFDEVEGALRAGDNVVPDLIARLGLDEGSDAAAAIARSMDRAFPSIRVTEAAVEEGFDAAARARALAEGGSRSVWSRPITWGGVALTGFATGSLPYIYAAAENASGGEGIRTAMEAAFDEAERRIEEGVDLEEVFDDLRSNADVIQFIVDPLDQALQEGGMQFIYDSWEANLNGAEPTAADVAELKASTLLNYTTQATVDFAMHSALIRWEVSEMAERGLIEESEVSDVYVDRFSSFLAENLNYGALEENGYEITAEDVEEILRTNPRIAGNIISDLPDRDAGILVHGMPELAESQPQVVQYIESGGLQTAATDPAGAVREVVDGVEVPGVVGALTGDPLGVIRDGLGEYGEDLGGLVGAAQEQFQNASGEVIGGLTNVGLTENQARMATGILGFMMIMNVGTRFADGLSDGGGLGARMGESMASLAVWTAAIGTMTAILNGEDPDAAFRATEGRLAPDTEESIALDRMALGGPARGVTEPEISPEEAAVVLAPPVEIDVAATLESQLAGLVRHMDHMAGYDLGPDGSELQAALDSGDLELAAQTAYRNLEEGIASLPEDMEGRQNLIDAARSHQRSIAQFSESLGFSIETVEVAGATFADEVEVARPDPTGHGSFGVVLDTARLPSGQELDAYQQQVYTALDVVSGFSTYADDPSTALQLAADVEDALEAGETERAANLIYDGLETLAEQGFADYAPQGDRDYLLGRAEATRSAIQAGGQEIGLSVGPQIEVADTEIAVEDPGQVRTLAN